MKKIFLILAILVSVIGFINAQNTAAKPQSAEERAKASVAKMNTTASLTGDQTTKINKIYIDYYKALDALEAKKAGMDSKVYAKEMSEITNKRNSSFASVLTVEQKTALENKNKQKAANTGAAPKN